MEQQPKPGWQTTEFYIALGAQLIALAVLLGWVSPTEAETINVWLIELAEKVGGLAVLGLATWQYIKARAAVKTRG